VSRFGRKCTYVVVGDGRDEETAAKQVRAAVPPSAESDCNFTAERHIGPFTMS